MMITEAATTTKEEIRKGSRVRLIWTDDHYTNLRAGDEGIVTDISLSPDGVKQYCIDWDQGSKLALLEGIDQFELLQ